MLLDKFYSARGWLFTFLILDIFDWGKLDKSLVLFSKFQYANVFELMSSSILEMYIEYRQVQATYVCITCIE